MKEPSEAVVAAEVVELRALDEAVAAEAAEPEDEAVAKVSQAHIDLPIKLFSKYSFPSFLKREDGWGCSSHFSSTYQPHKSC